MDNQKRVVSIQDISGFGKCSLTAALPILSACGISTCIMPTAILSSPTGGFKHTYRDLTSDLREYTDNFKNAGLTFDAIYSGFLGSFEQLEIVEEFIDKFKTKNNLVLVDPVMADSGKFYSTFTKDFVTPMNKLCSKADIIVPNITEACFMLGETYKDGPYNKDFIKKLLKGLAGLGPKFIVLTGIYFDEKKLGAACFDVSTGEIDYSFCDKVMGAYQGSGDIFASVLLSSLMNGYSIQLSTKIAAEFVKNAIIDANDHGIDNRFGISFEKQLPWLIKTLGLI